MPPLHEDLFGVLEDAVTKARTESGIGARAALQRLAVDEPEPFGHLNTAQRQLRTELRARGRQLGDRRTEDGRQCLDRLEAECAYEFWHRMLFARFLAENGLLIHPGERVAISLRDCEELGAEEHIDAWTYAARCAAHMLPQIFRPDDPLLQVPFAPEHLQKLEQILDGLPAEVFTADDSLGWVYQFWQTKRKKEVNESEVKIGGDELPAVTQLFTEHYMVQFLLHNTIGAWWVGRHPGQSPPVAMEYLRRREDGSPAAGTFPGWPATAKDLRILDPCCGSGHFLVAAFELLVWLRMSDEGLSAREACEAVLRENLFALELDPRCTQIAAFNLALAAWRLQQAHEVFSQRQLELPEMYIACSGQAPKGKREDWLRSAGNDKRLRWGMDLMFDVFRQANDLGSLINPRAVTRSGSAMVASFDELQPLLHETLLREEVKKDPELKAATVMAQGMARAAELLAGQYHLVTTNVPYLARSKQADSLRNFLETEYGDAKADLATAFVRRCLDLCAEGGSIALVTPQNWLFLQRYQHLRIRLLEGATWNHIARLGPGAFRTLSGEVVKAVLLILSKRLPPDGALMTALDVSHRKTANEKADGLRALDLLQLGQAQQRRNPAAIIKLGSAEEETILGHYAIVRGGITTGDSPLFRRCWWEIPSGSRKWAFAQGGADKTVEYGGRFFRLLWEDGKGLLASRTGGFGATIAGREVWQRKGIAITYTGNFKSTLYTGELYENVICVIVPKDPDNLPAIWCFCTSDTFAPAVRSVNQKLSVDVRYFEKVPFDLIRWQAEAGRLYPNGLPEPHSNDPTQWLFKGDIARADAPHNLQVAVARLLGYRWPDQPADDLDRFADPEGIVCLPGLLGHASAAERLRDLLIAAYGTDWSSTRQGALLAAVDFGGKGLHEWLRDGFFGQHCALFHNCPFLWHIWDGRRDDGFSAIVNYHRLDRRRLELLTYTYLGEWIRRQTKEQEDGASGADGRLADALELQNKLKLILEGENPYDIFVRWKPLERQPIGWEPDLNDGVRLNIRPFLTADVLRKKPNITWKKDKGRDPETASWYHLFQGDRINDHHLSLAEKRAARAAGSSGP